MKHLRITALPAEVALLAMLGALVLTVPDKSEARSSRTDRQGLAEAGSAVLHPSERCGHLMTQSQASARPLAISGEGEANSWQKSPRSRRPQGSGICFTGF